jgi:hypothetical protein
MISLLGLALSQCPTTPSIPESCDACVSLDANDPTIPNSQTRCVRAGETMTISSINIDDNATLLICGTLIFNGNFNLSRNGSQVIVATGGSLYVASSLTISNHSAFINYGLLNVQNNLTLDGSGSRFWNVAPSGVLTVGGNIVLNASTNFINDGTNVQAHSLLLNGNATVCMTNGACFSLTNLIKNGIGNIVVGSGTAAISYTGSATIHGGNLTNTDSLYICQAPGATVNDPNNFGTQNVVSNCTSGCNVLSIIDLSISVRTEEHYLYIQWLCQGCSLDVTYKVSAITINGENIYIETTTDNHLAIPTSSLPAKNGFIQVTVLDSNKRAMISRIIYYDIRTVDKLIVYPTIVESEVNVWYREELVVFELYDSYGRLVKQVSSCGTWDLSDLPSGVYLIIAQVNGHNLAPVRILKK